MSDSGQKYYRDTWVEINLDSIEENIKNIQGLLDDGVEIYAVVKANAYGHGYEQVAQVALEAGATRLAVAFLDEALLLRRRGITAPILVLGVTRAEDLNVAAEHGITLTAFQAEWLEKACDLTRPLNIHLKFDTGMGRLGIRTREEVATFIEGLKKQPMINVEGVYTHFSTADELDNGYVMKQITRFQEMIQWVKELGVAPKIVHCSNSASAIRGFIKEVNAVRVGIAMYGLTPSIEMTHLIPFELKPAFSLKSRLTHVKRLDENECISYGATYCTEEKQWVGTVPLGYADGWTRRLQGFHVLVDGKKLPIIGRICMDQFMIKLYDEVTVGTEVTLIGKQSGEQICVEDVAEHLETINYEIVCMISRRVPRLYIRHGKVIEIKNDLF